jgi:DNA-binding transcriptional ArsR family regulator
VLVGKKVSDSNEEPYATIFASLKHPIRRKILRMLSKNTMSFSEMLEALNVSSSFLTYHLENLGELILKTDDGRYKLSSFGEAALATMTKVEDIPATAHLQSTSSTKVVRRTTAIALGIICIVLVAGLVGGFGYFIMTINDKDGTISSLNTQISSKNSQISQLNSNLTNLQNQVNDLTNTLNLAKTEVGVNSQTVSQPADNYTFWIPSCSYAGYLSVQVESSTTDKTYTEVLWHSYGINYDNRISVGTNGTGIFPVLPSRIVEVRVGNTNPVDNATETVTITYHY